MPAYARLPKPHEVIAAFDFFHPGDGDFLRAVLLLRYRARTGQDSARQRYGTSHCRLDRATTMGSISGTLPVPLRDFWTGIESLDGEVTGFLKPAGLEPKRTRVQAPWQNGIAERWIGSFRREILDHVIPLNEDHLRRIMRDYVTCHEAGRLHDSLAKDAPNRRAVEQRPGSNTTAIALSLLGGLHHRYTWRQAGPALVQADDFSRVIEGLEEGRTPHPAPEAFGLLRWQLILRFVRQAFVSRRR